MLTFLDPRWLLALLTLPALWAITLLGRAGGPLRQPWRLAASLLLRTSAIAALVLALSGAQLAL
ncbi:MAG: hypothetical protein H7Y32_17430, partial [Chloroflexales bacterium]|nr:hypothetical protein [Chloroflexales bacterium]